MNFPLTAAAALLVISRLVCLFLFVLLGATVFGKVTLCVIRSYSLATLDISFELLNGELLQVILLGHLVLRHDPEHHDVAVYFNHEVVVGLLVVCPVVQGHGLLLGDRLLLVWLLGD